MSPAPEPLPSAGAGAPLLAAAAPAANDADDGGWRGLGAAWKAVLVALLFRGACYAVMTAAAVWNELRPAPTLPDALLARVPYVEWVAGGNYLLWLGIYLPLAAALLWTCPRAFVRYNVTGALVSLVRGGTLLLTGLGPPDPLHAGPGIAGRSPWQALGELLSPWDVFVHGSMRAYLTKDLFFSGHTATTFLLLLYAWRWPRLRWPALVGHALVVGSVFLSHLHYAIDVVGAYAVTFALFALREGWPARQESDVPGTCLGRVSKPAIPAPAAAPPRW